jgi:hypothetical protein
VIRHDGYRRLEKSLDFVKCDCCLVTSIKIYKKNLFINFQHKHHILMQNSLLGSKNDPTASQKEFNIRQIPFPCIQKQSFAT